MRARPQQVAPVANPHYISVSPRLLRALEGAGVQQQILDFWFGASGEASHGESRNEWFRRDPAFDALIAARFGEPLREAIDGGLETWSNSPRGSLALVILLDQFTRNVYRDTPQAFSGDRRALAVARAAVGRGDDGVLIPVER